MIFFLIPLWIVTSIDEEEFRYAIVSTVIHIKAILSGQYPIWTSYFGFGMPHPFLINFNYHPFLLLFYYNTNIAIQCIYAVHLIIGTIGIYKLCRIFAYRNVSIVAAITFIFSSPTINYLYTDFWITTFVGWTILPWLYYTVLRFVHSNCKNDLKYLSLLLSFVVSFLILNSHPSQALIYVLSILIILTTYIDRLVGKFKYLFASGLLSAATVASKIYFTISEALKFTTDLTIFKEPFSAFDLWNIFLRPIVVGSPSYIVQYNLEQGSRGLFVGGVFVISAIVTSIMLFKNNEVTRITINFFILSIIYLFRPDFIYSFVSTVNVFREPLIIIIIILAVIGINYISYNKNKFKIFTKYLLILHLVLIFGGFIPFWWNLINVYKQNNDYPAILKNLIERPIAIDKIKQAINNDSARVYISDNVFSDFGSKKLKDLGLSANSLPFFGIRVINGFFKGISYEEACKGPYIYGKLVKDDNCKIENQSFLDIGSVDFIIKYNVNDYSDNSLKKIIDIGEGPKGVIGLYRNVNVWDDAVFMSKEALNIELPLLEGCNDHSLGCSDISVLDNFRIIGEKIDYFRDGNSIVLNISNHVEDEKIILLSEFAHFGWQAKWYGLKTSGNLKIEKIGNFFIGIIPPSEARKIVLEYHDNARKYLEYFSIFSMLITSLYLIIIKQNIFIRKV